MLFQFRILQFHFSNIFNSIFRNSSFAFLKFHFSKIFNSMFRNSSFAFTKFVPPIFLIQCFAIPVSHFAISFFQYFSSTFRNSSFAFYNFVFPTFSIQRFAIPVSQLRNFIFSTFSIQRFEVSQCRVLKSYLNFFDEKNSMFTISIYLLFSIFQIQISLRLSSKLLAANVLRLGVRRGFDKPNV